MREVFTLEDIFNVMIELETLGHKHYVEMQEMTDDYKLKELFSLLATQEFKHKEIYTKYKNMNIAFESSKAEVTQFPTTVISANKIAPTKVNHRVGLVSLVGAGPGDADLLTVKALRIIEHADLIVYDNLVSEQIRALFPATAEQVYAGKMKGLHTLTQVEINQLLIKKALQGLNVCRLKGGDAFVFGRELFPQPISPSAHGRSRPHPGRELA